jgi:ribosome maturation factor RimP
MALKEEIAQLVQEKLVSTENFLVEVKVSPAKIIVIIDHPKGVKIEDCVSLNRFLHEKMDETGLFNTHELEVGSPGMEEPLLVLPQFKKRIGQRVSVLTFDGMKRSGKLIAADATSLEIDEEITLRTGKKKETINKLNRIPFTDIKETRVIFSFDKIISSK